MTDRLTRLRRIALASVLAGSLAAPVAMQAVPAYPGVIKAQQPDGTVVEILMTGDERGHHIFTTDGFMLLRDKQGFMTYAMADADGLPVASAMRASSPQERSAAEIAFIAGIDKAQVSAAAEKAQQLRAATRAGGENPRYLFSGAAFPSKGSPKGLVVLVEYQDVSFSIDDPRDYFSRMLNEEGFSEMGATGSARDFYIENSNGVMTPDFDVYGPIKLAYNHSHYGANDANKNDIAPEEMVIEACQALDDTVDFSVYDTDGDGQIDNVFVFYAGNGESDSGLANTVWPHSADILDLNLGTEYKFDGKILNRYACTAELTYAFMRVDGIGTFVHEFSHVMGLPDLYSTDYSKAFTPGPYSTLDVGPYNNQGRTPPHYSAFERYCLDWLEPEVLEEEGEYTLEALHLSNKAYLIKTDKDTEFYLFENRQQECCDAFIPGHGMLVWHIDYMPKIWDSNIVNNLVSHQYVDLIEADRDASDNSRSGDTFPGSKNVTEFTRTSKPAIRAWSGADMPIGLTNIREEDGKIKFNVALDYSGVEEVAAAGGVRVLKGGLANDSDQSYTVYGLTGVAVAQLAPGATVELPAGIYLVKGGEECLKLTVR